jgi:hypothetical protein
VIERLSDEELAYLSSVFGELLGYETALTDGLHSPGIRRARGARAMAEELRARRAADLTDGDLDLIDSGLAALASDYPDYDRGDGAVRVEALRAKLKEPRRGV